MSDTVEDNLKNNDSVQTGNTSSNESEKEKNIDEQTDSINTSENGNNQSLSDSSDVPEYNILLLGETGAGKSTTINAIANYLKYSTFEAAKNNEFINLIPSKFTLPNPKTGNPFEILSGSDANEHHSDDGASSTQAPKAYTFQLNNWLLRIIDTPGMGDTAGVNADKENFEKILNHLHHYERLHGICFLIKSNETRKTAYFRYCITELLTHLHKSACKNIVFCFTFSRNSFYGPGEGFTTLKGFLKNELKDVAIELKAGENCFFIDNEAYRYLVAKKQQYPFSEKIENSYLESWDESVEQTEKMWDKIKHMAPHELQNTCSLNNARKLILELAEPMVQLQNNINTNIEHIKKEENRVAHSREDQMKLAQSLMVQVDDLEMRPLPYPTTICTASKCVEVVQFQDNVKTNYKTRCHERCRLTSVQTNVVGHEILRKCKAMEKSLNCVKCGCPWQKHMHITCLYDKVKRPIVDANKQKEIKSRDDAIKSIEAALKSMQNTVDEYSEEYRVIQDVTSKFAYILISNSITPYNQFIEPYLDMLIEEERKKFSSIADYSRNNYESLVKMKKVHRESVQILSEAIDNKSADKVQLGDIYSYRDQLFDLKHTGPQFRQIMNVTDSVKNAKFENIQEQNFDLRIGELVSTGISWVKDGAKKVSNLISNNFKTDQRKNAVCNLCDRPGHKNIYCRWETAEIREQIVKVKELCPICLISGHELVHCTNTYVCKVCRGKHSAVICTRIVIQRGNNDRNFQQSLRQNNRHNDRTNKNCRKK